MSESRPYPAPARAQAAAAGFTLLEVLVALVVLGVLMTALIQGIAFGLRAWATESRIIASRGDLDPIDRTLRRLIRQMDPGTANDPRRMQGTAERLVMTTELPVTAGVLRNRRIDALLMVDDKHRLVLHWLPHLHAIRFGPAPPPRQTVLLGGVQGVEFAYWPASPGAGHWAMSWTEARLPALVRVRLVFPAGDHRHWPDIVAAPALDRPDR